MQWWQGDWALKKSKVWESILWEFCDVVGLLVWCWFGFGLVYLIFSFFHLFLSLDMKITTHGEGYFLRPQRLCFCRGRFKERGIQQSCDCQKKFNLWAEIVHISDNECTCFLEGKLKLKASKRNRLHGVIQTAHESMKGSVCLFQLLFLNLSHLWLILLSAEMLFYLYLYSSHNSLAGKRNQKGLVLFRLVCDRWVSAGQCLVAKGAG